MGGVDSSDSAAARFRLPRRYKKWTQCWLMRLLDFSLGNCQIIMAQWKPGYDGARFLEDAGNELIESSGGTFPPSNTYRRRGANHRRQRQSVHKAYKHRNQHLGKAGRCKNKVCGWRTTTRYGCKGCEGWVHLCKKRCHDAYHFNLYGRPEEEENNEQA